MVFDPTTNATQIGLYTLGVIFRPQGWKSKQTWGYFPSATDGKIRACGCYFLSVRTEIYVLKALFSFPRNGKVSKPEAIFHPPRTEKKTMRTLFYIHADRKESKHETIFRPPLTKK